MDMFLTVKPPGQGLLTDAQMASYLKPQRYWIIRVEGYDTGLPADDIKKALKDHFRSCGAIANVEIHDSYALVIMVGDDADEKALEHNGTEVGGCKLVVDPKPFPSPNFVAKTGALSLGGNPGT